MTDLRQGITPSIHAVLDELARLVELTAINSPSDADVLKQASRELAGAGRASDEGTQVRRGRLAAAWMLLWLERQQAKADYRAETWGRAAP